jgi:hypothetical protein
MWLCGPGLLIAAGLVHYQTGKNCHHGCRTEAHLPRLQCIVDIENSGKRLCACLGVAITAESLENVRCLRLEIRPKKDVETLRWYIFAEIFWFDDELIAVDGWSFTLGYCQCASLRWRIGVRYRRSLIVGGRAQSDCGSLGKNLLS